MLCCCTGCALTARTRSLARPVNKAHGVGIFIRTAGARERAVSSLESECLCPALFHGAGGATRQLMVRGSSSSSNVAEPWVKFSIQGFAAAAESSVILSGIL